MDFEFGFQEMAEESVAQQAREGNLGALGAIFRRLESDIRALCLAQASSPDEVEELVQEIYVKAFRSVSKLESTKNVGAWILQLTKQVVFDHRRNKTRKQISGGGLRAQYFPTYSVESIELHDQIKNAIRLLPSSERSVLLLHDLQDHTVAEIAEILKTTDAAVSTYLRKARLRMQAILQAGSVEIEEEIDPTGGDTVFFPELSVEHQKLLKRLHVLVDKQFEDNLSPNEQTELDSVKARIESIESAATAEFESTAERRHQDVLHQLSELVDELKKFRAHGELRAESG
jgi:RNA polymerase sigma-70 factor (ECF subfamily)